MNGMNGIEYDYPVYPLYPCLNKFLFYYYPLMTLICP